jgi:FlaA1/EpsC-like NDP-sugar epimerase
MMESSVIEAVRNNVLGTWNLACAARNVHRLLMISSDKAVNPICVMGATKRVCERIVSATVGSNQRRRRGSVRFGNVLGSNGSVVPTFQAQISAGGPVKVTHPDARRYFMTTSEAVSLVLEASIQSVDAEIFVLDMGEPIRIVDLAENMIRLAGLIPYDDIEIQFTGLRPGEKLVEELGRPDAPWRIHQEKVRTVREEPLSWDVLSCWIEELKSLVKNRDEQGVISHLQSLVPEYQPFSSWAKEDRVEPAPAMIPAGSRASLPLRVRTTRDQRFITQ